MKIVFVSDAVYPHLHGGKEKRLYEISTRLAKLGNDVHIYTMDWWKSGKKELVEDGVHFHVICKKYEMYNGDRRSIKEGILFGLACFKLIGVKFDILDVDHMPFFPIFSAWVVCKLRGKKLYGTWHESLTTQDWVSYMGKKGYIAAVIERVSIKLPHKITAASNQTKELLATYHKRTKNVEIVASGIDTKALKNIKPANVNYDVLYVGRLVKDKNIDELIKAIFIIKEVSSKVRALIIGDGVERRNLENLTTRLALSSDIKFIDPTLEANEIYSYMKASKVFCSPSSREGFGIVVLEALGCDTPVVTVNVPANSAKGLVVDGKTGSIVKLDAKSLAEAIMHWASDSSLMIVNDMSHFDWDTLVSRQVEVYES